MKRGRSIRLMATVIAAAAIGIGVTLWYRTPPRESASALQPHDAQRVSGRVSPESWRSLPAQPAASSADAAEVTATPPATATAGEAGLIVAGDVDQRQLAKITRGMSAAPAGGILVTGTPPGSVTGQLHLREGDVIMAVNGAAISTPDEFARIYQEQGTPRQLTIVRDGREIHRH